MRRDAWATSDWRSGWPKPGPSRRVPFVDRPRVPIQTLVEAMDCRVGAYWTWDRRTDILQAGYSLSLDLDAIPVPFYRKGK